MIHSTIIRLEDWRKGKVLRGPQSVHIDVVNACNLRCVTCWNWSNELDMQKSSRWKLKRMSLDTFMYLVDDLEDLQVERIIISGSGEPFANKNLRKMLHYSKSKFHITLISNGTLCDLAELPELGVNRLLLNMSASTAKTYMDYHPGEAEDTYYRLVNGVEKISNLISVSLVQVINKTNYFELVNMVALGARINSKLSFKLADIPAGCDNYSLSEQNIECLLRDIANARTLAKITKTSTNLNSFETQIKCNTESVTPNDCFAGYLYSRVYVDGRVFFCCAHLEAGNLNSTRFKDIWFSERYNKMRVLLRNRIFYSDCKKCGKYDMNYNASQLLEKIKE